MKKLTASFGIIVALILAATAGLAVMPAPEVAGRSAAEAWLGLVDAGKYLESWRQMDAGFKAQISQRKWKASITQIRKPFGKPSTRKFKTAQYSKELPGAPEGEYVVVQFDTVYEHKPDAVEKVTLILGQDLLWRVSSYAVK